MGEVRETIYIKADRNIEVTKPDVTVGDALKVECVNPTVTARVRSIRLLKFSSGSEKDGAKKNRVAVSILKVISCIHEVYPKAEIQNMGESDFIVTYEQQQTTGVFVHFLKAAAVVLISFTGAAFSIMTFNNDVDVKKVFSQIYELTTGMKSDGFTVDPTPIEVEMRLYENDLQTTLIEDYSRKEQELDVGK